jgi:hypothetical protein
MPAMGKIVGLFGHSQKRCGPAMEETSGGYFLAYLRGTAKIVGENPASTAGGIFAIFASFFSMRKNRVGN